MTVRQRSDLTLLDGHGLLRWLIWPRRAKDDEDERPSKRFRPKPRPKSRHPGVYRIEVDNEVGRFHGDGARLFWSSSRVILILSFPALVDPACGPHDRRIRSAVDGRAPPSRRSSRP